MSRLVAIRGRAVIGGEAKTTEQALDVMLDEVRFCVVEEDCTHREHRKIVGLRREQPRFFWAIRPGERRAFEVDYRTSRLDLHPVQDIPAYTIGPLPPGIYLLSVTCTLSW